MDNSFSKPTRRHTRELNLVPILDMMTTLIIFLLQITSFLEFTKITVPPSATATITDPIRPPPVSPKMFLMRKNAQTPLRVQLVWTGEKPGELHELVSGEQLKTIEGSAEVVLKAVKKVTAAFNTQFPGERTMQLGAASNIPYQLLISSMDGVQMAFTAAVSKDKTAKISDLANIVLVSYQDVDAEVARSGDFDSQ